MDISIALIRRCKKKDREAFDLLLSRCEEQLFRLCYSYARDKETALDFLSIERNCGAVSFAPLQRGGG